MNMETIQIAQLLNQTFSPYDDDVRSATEALDRFSLNPDFPFSLLAIVTGGDNQGLRIAAATYLKNFIRKNVDGEDSSFEPSKEFKDGLMQTLLQAEPTILKVLVEAFRSIAVAKFVKQNSWPELVPQLRSVIFNSTLINQGPNCQWNSINALTVLHSLLRPFQYFFNPKVAKEPVPLQLELLTQEILAPLLSVFHQFVDKVSETHARIGVETEKILLIICKCIYFAVKSHMSFSLPPLLPSFCRDLYGVLGSLSFDGAISLEDECLLRQKTGKRSLLIFCALITRHRKHSDKLMPDMINCCLNIVKYTSNIDKLDCPLERVLSLAFDVISHALETGPGWRLVSSRFPLLLDSAIFPALVLNEKDILEWEEDPDEYIRKNLPSDTEEVSGWREDLFTARKSAINLLGVMSMSKGPPVASLSTSSASKRKTNERKGIVRCRSMGELLVLPFLSKFPFPSEASLFQTRTVNEYYGVLMAYGGLQEFLKERKPEYTTTLLRARVLPLYTVSVCIPYLVATSNWVLGELASCLPEELRADIYSSLMNGLIMPDTGDISCYPVRASAAESIIILLENEYMPPEWMPLLQVVVNRIGKDDEESSILYQLLSSLVKAGGETIALHIPYIVTVLAGVVSKCIPNNFEPWPSVVNQGFVTLVTLAQSWEDSMPEDIEQNEQRSERARGQDIIARALSVLLQQTWLSAVDQMEGDVSPTLSCLDDSSTLLRAIMRSVSSKEVLMELKVSELLSVWANLIADFQAWEDSEDLSIFLSIKDAVNLHATFVLHNFIEVSMPNPPALPMPQQSIIKGIGVFVANAISNCPSATWRACSCIHMVLHVPSYSSETEGVKQSLVSAFSQVAVVRLREIQINPCPMWKPLVLAISSCYLCYPALVEEILEKNEDNGFVAWASELRNILNTSFEPALSTESEIKLVVLTLAKVVERLSELRSQWGKDLLDCFSSLMDASVRLKALQEEGDEEDNDEEEVEDDDDEIDEDSEDSETEEHEETEEQFLDRYAKAAIALENGAVVEEGDIEDQELDLELGDLEEVDEEGVVWSVLKKLHQVLINAQQPLPPQHVSTFLDAFPQYKEFFL